MQQLRTKARELLRQGKAKQRREMENWAVNISHRKSRKASQPPRELVAKYRRLVVADISAAALDDAIALMSNISEITQPIPIFEDGTAKLIPGESVEAARTSVLSADVRAFLNSVFDIDSRQSKKRKLNKQQERIWLASGVTGFPGFIKHYRTEISPSEASLHLDTGLIVFHQAYFGLLPAIPKSLTSGRDLLLKCFLVFSGYLTNVADQERVRALVHMAHNDPILAEVHFRQALNATSPKEHEFITLLQMAWSHAVEHGRYVEATGLLMEHSSRVRKADYEEVKAMLLETPDMHRAA